MIDNYNYGIKIDELSDDVNPGDDLYDYVNAKYAARTEIPADKARYGSFHVLAEKAEDAVKKIIIECKDADKGSDAYKIGQLYTSFMNQEERNKLGFEPLAKEIARVKNLQNIKELFIEVAKFERSGGRGFFAAGIDNDPGNPKRYIIFIMQSGLGLPSEAYYKEEQFEEIRQKYQSHIKRMALLFNLSDSDVNTLVEDVWLLEQDIAKVHWSDVECRDIQKIYNLVSYDELKDLTPELDWDVYLEHWGITPEMLAECVAAHPSALAGIAKLFTEENLRKWKHWLIWNIINNYAPYLSDEISKANFEFYGTALTGTPKQRELWKRAVDFAESGMGEAIGRIYVEKHFDEKAKEAMDTLVANLIKAYEQSIKDLNWMSEKTKKKALDKLTKFTPKIGYPNKWKDYSELKTSDNLIDNVKSISEFIFQRELKKIGKEVDLEEWFMTPQTVNAYYNPGFNEIVFPAAILQPPFFGVNHDAAVNYGAIGAVIGHEIGHGFDDQGSRYDGDGKLVDWWSKEDRESFEQRTSKLIEQYNSLSPKQTPGQYVSGELTIGENIGDLGGLSIAWKAYLIHLDGAEPPIISGLSAAQRFFISWAQSWQQISRPEEVQRLLTIDPHSPNEFRCNQIVRNIDEFYDAFGVDEDNKLWLDPADRVSIW